MNKIPYMPELESVESSCSKKSARSGQILVCIFSFIFMICAFMGVSMLLKVYPLPEPPYRYGDNGRGWVSIVLFLCTMPLIIVYRCLDANYYVKTDNNGISTQSLLHKHFMLWDDVIDVKSRKSLWGTSLYFLKSNILSVTIRVNEDDLNLMASIWQHLSKCGMSEGLLLPRSVFSSQSTISTEIPEKIEWINPNPPNYICFIVLEIAIYLFLAGAIVFFLMKSGNHLFQFSQISLFLVYLAFMSRYVMYRTISVVPKHATLDGDVLHVDKYRKSVDIQLSQVKSATWEELDLRIVDQNKNMVFIPHINGDPVSTQLLLAIIRRLRLSPSLMFMPIPKELLNPKEDGS